MDIEKLRQAVIDKRFILSANPDWRAGRSCGLSGDETEQKANNALTIILENIEELVVAYLIDARQSVKSEEVQEAIKEFEFALDEDFIVNGIINVFSEYQFKVETINLAIAALQAYQADVTHWKPLPEPPKGE